MCVPVFAASFVLAALARAPAADPVNWSSFRGANRDGVSLEKGWSASFPAGGPKKLWSISVGTGASSVAVVGDRLYTMGNKGDKDTVWCVEAATGKEVWRFSYDCDLKARNFEGGPAATPTVDGDRVFTLSHDGQLYALGAAKGEKIWEKNLVKDLGGARSTWDYAGSPLVDGDMLIVDAGGKGSSTVALDKATGDLKWKKGNDSAGYGSPIIGAIDGKRTLVLFKGKAVVGLDPADGSELWRREWKTDYDVNAATPIIDGDRVFISSGYNRGCALLRIQGGEVKVLWENKNMRNHANGCVRWKDCVYGFDGQVNEKRRTKLTCLRLKDGSVAWSEGDTGAGSLIVADGKVIALCEYGELIIAEATPDAFKPLGRAQVIGGHVWVEPVLAGGLLYCKNNQGELICLDLRAK